MPANSPPPADSPSPTPEAHDPTKPLRFDSLTQEAYLQMWRTYDRMKALEEEMFSRFELSAQQYNTLRLLRSVHPAGMATLQIADRLISRAPDITRLIDRLEERGLVLRTRRPENRRVVEVALTDAGRQLLDELDEPVRNCHELQLGHLPPEELHELIRLMKHARLPHETSDSRWVADRSRP
ncbi:MAG: MarR family transcriptional regulator [Planctomyces sp.]|nr:MarR family transcriptional regulator [Planctomyces sp.]